MELNARTVWILVGFMAMVAIGLFFLTRTRKSQLDQDIISRSRQYVQRLGTQPTEKLSSGQKLILLHSYYNLKNYSSVVALGEAMVTELQVLPSVRQRPFIQMVDEAYGKLGKKGKAVAFRRKFQGIATASDGTRP